MPKVLRRLLYRLFVSPFVAGETYEEALTSVRELTEQGFDVTLDLLGEDILDAAAATKNVSAYIKTLESLSSQRLRDVNISVKLTMLGLMIDENVARENLGKLLVAAKRIGAFVRVDMENPNVVIGNRNDSLTEVTLRIVESFLPAYANHVGVVLQAYLHRTPEDAKRMSNLNCRIRLCKGAYMVDKSIAVSDRNDIQGQYKQISEYLYRSAQFPAFATHDDPLIEWVLRLYGASSSFEFQMLYGIRSDRARELLDAGYRVRIYVPIGTSWLPYFRRRLKEGNAKSLIWMFVRNIFNK